MVRLAMLASLIIATQATAQPWKQDPIVKPAPNPFDQFDKVGGKATVFGNGNLSCASAFQATNLRTSEEWILGYWSGFNMARVEDVGGHSDSAGIIGEVQLVCAKRPSMQLVFATLEARKNVGKPR